MAGIVASTLRRKAFRRGNRGSEQNKVAVAAAAAATVATDVNTQCCSPSASRRSSRSSSFAAGRSGDADDRSSFQFGQVFTNSWDRSVFVSIRYNEMKCYCHIRQLAGGYAIHRVCVSFCLSANGITKKVVQISMKFSRWSIALGLEQTGQIWCDADLTVDRAFGKPPFMPGFGLSRKHHFQPTPSMYRTYRRTTLSCVMYVLHAWSCVFCVSALQLSSAATCRLHQLGLWPVLSGLLARVH